MTFRPEAAQVDSFAAFDHKVQAAGSPNVVLANRDVASALRFVARISGCLAEFEEEMQMGGSQAGPAKAEL